MGMTMTGMDATAEISAALRRVSPRFTHPRIAVRSVVIYAAVLGVWIAVTTAAWFARGLAAWSVGLLYVLYDTWLLIYVARKTYYILRAAPLRESPVPAAGPPGAPAGGLTAAGLPAPPVGRVPVEAPSAALLAAPAAGPPGAPAGTPSVGILIAAFNESPALPTTLEALLPQLRPGDVVMVVDDGSHDDTGAMLEARFGIRWPQPLAVGRSPLHPALQVLRARHGGKARALNSGLALLRTDLVVTVDADTKLAADALVGLRSAFEQDPAMVAACCVIRPTCAEGPMSGFFQWFQTYEYIRAFCSRIAWMRADALLLVSGAFAAFRREPLLTVGGFDPDCLVEDYELIHRLHRFSHDHGLNWRVNVLSAPRAVTDAPASLPSFLRQRRRWFAGFLQTQYWNCDMTFNRRYGTLGSWMLPIKALDTMQPIFGLTAFALLIVFGVTGRLSIVLPVLAVILTKVCIDVGFHLWWVHVYGRWTGQPMSRGGLGLAFLAALAEPFSFQLMRHAGAAWGWCSFVTRRHSWGSAPSLPVLGASPE
jgi:cellulose synthase/poly-beta-1,6-N-acetylglucosamine synthase-like glycosyltransferase